MDDPDGVARVIYLGKELAYAPLVQGHFIKGTYHLAEDSYCIEWKRWSFEQLFWSHTTALLLLHGVSLQQALPGWLVLKGDRWPHFYETPGASNVVLADLIDPPPLSDEQLFSLLLSDAGGCASTSF